ncbi:MAG: DUF72 domain-containing protein [Candidatus Bathyarchaeota archaeon]|nr:DUF72 domain-containing protein [Candidatus Bathyarchaeota archaeon]
MSKENILLGTSGWSYREWEAIFYQKSEKRKLRAYSKVFKTVEIDSTFYRYPSKGMVMGWLRYSPSDFVFSAKLPKVITHDKKLGLKEDISADLEAYLELMRPLQLGGKLGCLLIQLPPSYEYNPENLESFFKLLDPLFRYAVEFRNLSWMKKETWKLLKEYKVAYTNVDEPLLPPEVNLTTDFTYFRWHGRGEKPWFDYLYEKTQIDEWVPKVEDASKNVKKVYGYFNNHFHGYAPENCLYLIERLGLLSEEQKKAKQKVAAKQSQIASFFG